MANAWEIYTNLFDDADQIIVEDAGLLHSKGDTFGKLPSPLMHDHNITDGACRLYAHMHWRYGKNQKNFEGRGKIANFLGVSPATITKRIQELEATDWIVVIERHRPNTASNFLTPFYHVFESQADARRFRAAYKPRAGEKVRPKPELKKRKSRKGIGGNPKLKKHVTTQVEPTSRDNSSSHDSPVSRDNSSSHYPDSESYPDSDIAPGGETKISEPLPPQVETTFDDLKGYMHSRDVDKHGPVRNARQSLEDAIYAAFGWEKDRTPKSAQGNIAAAVRDLYPVGYRAADIPIIYAYCAKRFSDDKGFTPAALSKHAQAAMVEAKSNGVNPLAGYVEVEG